MSDHTHQCDDCQDFWYCEDEDNCNDLCLMCRETSAIAYTVLKREAQTYRRRAARAKTADDAEIWREQAADLEGVLAATDDNGRKIDPEYPEEWGGEVRVAVYGKAAHILNFRGESKEDFIAEARAWLHPEAR
jgi:hypothetical protein